MCFAGTVCVLGMKPDKGSVQSAMQHLVLMTTIVCIFQLNIHYMRLKL